MLSELKSKEKGMYFRMTLNYPEKLMEVTNKIQEKSKKIQEER